MQKKENIDNKIIIYQTKDNEINLDVKLEKETVWLTQAQLSSLFSVERSVITKHLNNIFFSKELLEKSNVQKMHIANSDKPVKFYSLDAIISVGYRVNSKRATQFRIWATKTLKNYLLKGYILNEKRLLEAKNHFNELKETINFLQKKSGHKLLKGQEGEIISLLSDYSKTLTLLNKYDKNRLSVSKKAKESFRLEYGFAKNIILELKKDLIKKREADNIFGQEYVGKFEAIVNNIYQTFDKKEFYPSLEEKAAHLLYFIIKDHSFVDGNKRIGAFIFIYFLDKNDYLYRKTGEKKINDNALVALALLVAVSNPNEKDKLVKMIINLLI